MRTHTPEGGVAPEILSTETGRLLWWRSDTGALGHFVEDISQDVGAACGARMKWGAESGEFVPTCRRCAAILGHSAAALDAARMSERERRRSPEGTRR